MRKLSINLNGNTEIRTRVGWMGSVNPHFSWTIQTDAAEAFVGIAVGSADISSASASENFDGPENAPKKKISNQDPIL